MISLGLSSAQQTTYSNLLKSSHIVTPIVQILDLQHARLSTITGLMSEGQVTLDADNDITRALSITLFDPTHSTQIDSTSPGDGALHLDRMIAAYHYMTDPAKTVSFVTPVFCGPITKAGRDGVWMSIEAQGKETFGLREAWTPRTYKKGAKKTDVIINILRVYLGEFANKYQIPNLSAKLTRDFEISTSTKPWAAAKQLARSMGYQLFYDGRGVCRMRKWPTRTVWSFREDETILTTPQIGHDLDNLVNAVYVKGAVPKGKKSPIVVRKVAPSTHPLSPYKLGRNGNRQYYWAKIEDDHITTKTEALAVATNALNRGLKEATELTFDALTHPGLEEFDQVGCRTSEFGHVMPLRKYTVPLLSTGSSSVGYLRRSTVQKSRIRRRK